MTDLIANFEAHRSELERIALRITRSRPDAEDVVQTAFLRALETLDDRRDHWDADHWHAWLVTVVRRAAVDAFRRNRFRARVSTIANYDLVARESDGIESWRVIEHDDVWHLVTSVDLPSIMRRTLRLRFVEGMSYKQIAQKLGISAQTVGTRLHRATQLLREQLQHAHECDEEAAPATGKSV